MTTSQRLSFPRLSARTLRFTLGAPRNLTVSQDGRRITFLRAPSGTDRGTQLWAYDVESGTERLIADPERLLRTDTGETLSPEEQARRERAREGAGGIVAYATDGAVRIAVFALSSRLWVADLDTAEVRELPAQAPVIDPRPNPAGRLVAYASASGLRITSIDGSGDRALVESDSDTVVWGLADFIASEELHRYRGYWWAPDGSALLVERYDEAPVPVWYISDPSNPDSAPRPVRYPAAGTQNAELSLWLLPVDGSAGTEVEWDHAAFPYLDEVVWSSHGVPLLSVLTRDQKTQQILGVDLATGQTELLRELRDEAWVDLVPGLPAWLPDGRLLTASDSSHTRRLAFDGKPVTPEGLQISGVLGIDDTGVLVSATTEPTEQHVVRIGTDGSATPLTNTPGLHRAHSGGPVTVLLSQTLDEPGLRVRVTKNGTDVGTIESLQERPPFEPNVSLVKLGDRELRGAVLFPRDYEPGSGRRLPILLDPYGGPHAQRVRAVQASYLGSQWFADQGFCVVVVDGRGTPNRGPEWERQIRNDFVSVLDDQVEAVERIAEAYPDDVDTSKVAIRGWSFGGYLAAMAVLRRPDVFHAAVAGAPVTDTLLYDTAYNERYLGHPDEQPDVYEHNSLIGIADQLTRPLLLIHGLADDNVLVAHSLRLSSALLAAGKPHIVLPLTGVTHMASQEEIAENLLHFELDFLRKSLVLETPSQ